VAGGAAAGAGAAALPPNSGQRFGQVEVPSPCAGAHQTFRCLKSLTRRYMHCMMFIFCTLSLYILTCHPNMKEKNVMTQRNYSFLRAFLDLKGSLQDDSDRIHYSAMLRVMRDVWDEILPDIDRNSATAGLINARMAKKYRDFVQYTREYDAMDLAESGYDLGTHWSNADIKTFPDAGSLKKHMMSFVKDDIRPWIDELNATKFVPDAPASQA